MSSESQIDQFKLDEVAQSNIFNDITDKFRAYRQNADATAVKLKEANTMIDQLKTEINMSRSVEENLRSQILSAENRLIHLQRTVTKILKVSERIHQSEKVSLENERKIGEIQEAIQKIKEECRNFFTSTSNELNLMNEIEELKLKLKNEKSANNVLKIKNQTLSKQKEKEEMQHEDKCRVLENDLENLRREKTEMQVQFDLTLRAYKKQIEDHEFTIKEYERERKSLIEEFATPKSSEDSSDIAWVDTSVLLIPEDRSPKNFKSLKRSTKGENKNFSCSKSSQNVSSNTGPKHVDVNTQKYKRQKPQLEFLTSNSEKPSSDAPPLKRRRKGEIIQKLSTREIIKQKDRVKNEEMWLESLEYMRYLKVKRRRNDKESNTTVEHGEQESQYERLREREKKMKARKQASEAQNGEPTKNKMVKTKCSS